MSPGKYHLFPALNQTVEATNLKSNKTGNVISRRPSATTIAMENTKVLHIYSECVFVALGTQHVMCMHHTVICGLFVPTKFFHSISNMA
jgi:hypothetical protein